MLKAALQQQHPELASMKGGSNAIKEKMAEILPDVWRSLSPKLFQTLCESMPRRVAAVIANKGWYTKY